MKQTVSLQKAKIKPYGKKGSEVFRGKFVGTHTEISSTVPATRLDAFERVKIFIDFYPSALKNAE